MIAPMSLTVTSQVSAHLSSFHGISFRLVIGISVVCNRTLVDYYSPAYRASTVLLAVVCRHLSLYVTLPACERVGRRARGQSTAAGPGAWTVGWPTLHGGPVRLHPVRATPCTTSVGWLLLVRYENICPHHTHL